MATRYKFSKVKKQNTFFSNDGVVAWLQDLKRAIELDYPLPRNHDHVPTGVHGWRPNSYVELLIDSAHEVPPYTCVYAYRSMILNQLFSPVDIRGIRNRSLKSAYIIKNIIKRTWKRYYNIGVRNEKYRTQPNKDLVNFKVCKQTFAL